jgi:hypothetical protein
MAETNGDDVLQQIEQDAKAWERDLEVDRNSPPQNPRQSITHSLTHITQA